MTYDVFKTLTIVHQSYWVCGQCQIEIKSSSAVAETALQGGLVMAKSGRLQLGDNINGHYRSIFNHCDVIGEQSNRIR